MPIRVYVATEPEVSFGDTWEEVGTIDTSATSINQQSARALQKSSGGNPRLRVEFYLSGDPESTWVQDPGRHDSFGIAFDLLGDKSRVLIANKAATVKLLGTRPPEPHPGWTVQPVMIGIKVAGGVTRT